MAERDNDDDDRVRRSLSLLRAQQEASIDGILVVDEERRVASCNRRFLEMWGIPPALAELGDDQALIASVLVKLRDPDRFLARVAELYAHPDESSRDEIELLDGRVFDRYSAPARGEEGEHFGRVWGFRDVTERHRSQAALDEVNRRLQDALRSLEQRDALLRADLEQARAFQQSILPAAPGGDETEVDVVYQPLDRVGGDLYHLARQERWLRLIVADATGHGVTAALFTMLLRSEYEAARQHAERPGALLGALNDRLVSAYGKVGVRFTALCADLDLESGVLRWSSAAHPAPLLVRRGVASELATGGTFVGVARGVGFPEWWTALEARDALCVYTDGVTEATNARGEAFGEDRLGAALLEADAAGAPLATAAARARNAWIAGGRAADDATVVTVRWLGA
jgi:PAS domain S-box-containing protein